MAERLAGVVHRMVQSSRRGRQTFCRSP